MAKILIVDDAKFALAMLSKIVSESGHEIITASNGREGLARTVKDRPDVILTDLLMPEMDGLEFIAALRDEGIEVPVVVITANIQETVRQRCVEAGVVAFINKPPKRDAILQAVAAAFSARAPAE